MKRSRQMKLVCKVLESYSGAVDETEREEYLELLNDLRTFSDEIEEPAPAVCMLDKQQPSNMVLFEEIRKIKEALPTLQSLVKQKEKTTNTDIQAWSKKVDEMIAKKIERS